MAFAILIPLLVLVIVGFLLLCLRRRRKEALSALGALVVVEISVALTLV
jgi:hypothetical protein